MSISACFSSGNCSSSSATRMWRIVRLESGPVFWWTELLPDEDESCEEDDWSLEVCTGGFAASWPGAYTAVEHVAASMTDIIHVSLRAPMRPRSTISIQNMRKIMPRIGPGQLRDLFRRARSQFPAASRATFWTEVDSPVRSLDDL